ncbi:MULTISPECIES: hypothetical protein [Salinibaculum]|uniref:hypothetical protein n=1 Tax=Salinibaculum TaxID=2732368 RepID=UPI0030D0CD9A
MSSRSAKHQAHLNQTALSNETKRSIVTALLPIEEFKQIRDEHLVPTYVHVAQEIDDVSENLSDKSNSELREIINERYGQETDPHPLFNRIDSAWETVKWYLSVISVVLIALGMLLTHDSLLRFAINKLSLTTIVTQVLPLTLVGGVVIYVWVMRADTFVHKTLHRELRAVRGRTYQRRRTRLIGYAIWNDSIHRQSGLLLLSVIYLLKSLPNIPLVGRWFSTPHQTALQMTREHAQEIYECSSTREVISHIFQAWRQ